MKWRTLLLLCGVVLINGDGDDEEWRLVKSPQGPVRGRKDPAGLYVFSNIPYATAPKGVHKFSEPLPAPAWLQPLEVPDKGIICPQELHEFIDPETKIMQEDCLIANVYVPITYKKNLPVVVYIHGGAFQVGFGDRMTPKSFVNEKTVIVVTFNYRLGVHGFLCLGTQSVPGNAGLKDQVALLRWVKRNIASYGGNPENVTVAGYSAGSISADLLMLAKSTKGLFNKIILESGVGVASVAIQTNPLENAKVYAKKFNFTDFDNIEALEDFYTKSSLDSLVGNTFFDRKDASVLFGPCVERKSNSAFLDDSPLNIIRNGYYTKVPILIGISKMDGMIHILKFKLWKNAMNEKFFDFLPADLYFDNKDEKQEIAKIIKEFYFGDKIVNDDTVLSYIAYHSDVNFGYPTLRTIKMHVENGHNDIYLYEYSFVDNDADVIPYTLVRGAGHCAQTIAILDGISLWSGNKEAENLSEEYSLMKTSMRELWYNFIVYKSPVIEGSSFPVWPPVGVDGSPHMSLGKSISLSGTLLESRAGFWDDIYEKYYRNPISPPMPPHSEL